MHISAKCCICVKTVILHKLASGLGKRHTSDSLTESWLVTWPRWVGRSPRRRAYFCKGRLQSQNGGPPVDLLWTSCGLPGSPVALLALLWSLLWPSWASCGPPLALLWTSCGLPGSSVDLLWPSWLSCGHPGTPVPSPVDLLGPCGPPVALLALLALLALVLLVSCRCFSLVSVSVQASGEHFVV